MKIIKACFIFAISLPLFLYGYEKPAYQDSSSLDFAVDEIFKTLNDKQKVGQMMVAAVGKYGKPTEVVVKLVKEQKLGGILLLNGTKTEFIHFVQQFDSLSKAIGALPLLYSADGEPSLINRKIKGLPTFLKTGEITTVEECKRVAYAISEELLAIGIRHNFAPVVDVAVNKTIFNRSFGVDHGKVATLSNTFIGVSTEHGIVATAKHFPGHGYVKGDSHTQLVTIEGSLKELDIYESLIANGVLSIMVGHIAVSNNEKYQTNGLPSTCSKKIVTDLLKNELGFRGLVITDAMNMGALKHIKQPELKAVQAGCDMILMPKDPSKVIEEVLNEMNKNEDFRNQVYESVKKIIGLKLVLGLMQ